MWHNGSLVTLPCCVRWERLCGCNGLPVEIHSLLRELPVAMVRVLKGLILHDLYPFSPVTLLMAVFADHIQLSDFVLQSKQRNGDREVSPGSPLMNPPRCPLMTGHTATNHIGAFCGEKPAATGV